MTTAGHIARQVYVDLVRRRSIVRITPAVERSHETEPGVFLLGAYRSGTTLLRYVVDAHPDIACPPESDFLLRLTHLIDDDRSMRGLLSMGYDSEHVVQRLAKFSSYFFANYAHSVGKSRWADKSPAYIDRIDFLLRLFPLARYVVLHRHPLDQVHSHTKGGMFVHEPLHPLRRGNEDIRLTAARYWVATTTRLLAHEADQRFLTVRYEDLCARPTEVTRTITDHIGVPWSRDMLDFASARHDFGAEAASTRRTSAFEWVGGRWTEWQKEVLEDVWELVAPLGTRLGYSRELVGV